MSVIVGISALYHDSACCVMRDGIVTSAIQEERLSRVKNDPGFPWRAFRACLADASVTVADIDCVAVYEDSVAKAARQIWTRLVAGTSESSAPLLSRLPGRFEAEVRETLGYEGHIEIVSHHLSHAASAYFFSGYSDAAVLTIDGVGEWATTTFGLGRAESLEVLEEVNFPHSIGLLYSTLTTYLGFEANEGEYKVMGLAPYGSPRFIDALSSLITSSEDGQFRLNMKYFDFMGGKRGYSNELIALLGESPRSASEPVERFHQDVARSLQLLVEQVMLEKVRYLHQRVPSENLCLAGGVALNCVANGRILREGPFKHLFVPPAPGDAGAALGAAAIAHVRATGERPAQPRLTSALLGPQFTTASIARLLETSNLKVHDFRADEDGLLAETVERLIRGDIVGWFQGRMEFGPRALGARSILADPRRSDMRDRINAMVKKREAFRPFAPAVLAQHTSQHFNLDHASPFMLETVPVRSGLDLPAITHVDGSARVQTVCARDGGRFAKLLEKFYEATGCPILLNTSFNVKGDPIVCSPLDALACFGRAGLDSLAIGCFLLHQQEQPSGWLERLGAESVSPRAVSAEVYAML